MTTTYTIDGLVTGGPDSVGTTAQDAWRDWCNDVHGMFDITFGNEGYRGRVVRQRTSNYQLVAWTSEAEVLKRRAAGIRRDPRGHYELLVPLQGTLVVGVAEALSRLVPGEMAIVPFDTPFEVAHDGGARALTLLVPGERIDQRLGPTSDRGARVHASRGLAKVGRDLIVSLLRERNALSGRGFDAAADRVVDLLCLAADGDEQLPDAADTQPVLEAVRRYIREHATDPELTVAAMAHAIGWSLRYVQSVLARENLTARELIRIERLELARARLANPAFASRNVAAIAMSVGFTSPSAFSNAYRRHFGQSPRETRHEIGPPGPASC